MRGPAKMKGVRPPSENHDLLRNLEEERTSGISVDRMLRSRWRVQIISGFEHGAFDDAAA
jgi:hypothetical protein